MRVNADSLRLVISCNDEVAPKSVKITANSKSPAQAELWESSRASICEQPSTTSVGSECAGNLTNIAMSMCTWQSVNVVMLMQEAPGDGVFKFEQVNRCRVMVDAA